MVVFFEVFELGVLFVVRGVFFVILLLMRFNKFLRGGMFWLGVVVCGWIFRFFVVVFFFILLMVCVVFLFGVFFVFVRFGGEFFMEFWLVVLLVVVCWNVCIKFGFVCYIDNCRR